MNLIPSSGALMGRAVPEWIGKTPDSKPPKAVVDRIFLRQDGRCPLAKRKIMVTDARAVDHIIPLKDGGENRESNLQIILADKHKEKTSAENTSRVKVNRTRMKNNGTWPKSRRPLRSRNSFKPYVPAAEKDWD